jgi:hypothetical protein
MDKEEIHWLFGVMQGWFSAKLGSKISSDGSQLLSAQFPLPPTATWTQQTGINHFYSSILYVWPELTTPKLSGAYSQQPPVQFSFLKLR